MRYSPAVPGVYTSLGELVALEGRARGFSFLPRQPVESLLSGSHASKLRGRGLDFAEIRRYQAGDDVRFIDWKVTARTRKPHTRVFTEERERSVLLVVDQRLSMFFGSRAQMKSVTAAEAAALAGWRTIRAKDRIGALVFNDTEVREIRPQRTRQNVVRVLQAVLDMNLALAADADVRPNPGMLNDVLGRARRLVSHDVLVCLITDASGSDGETRALLTTISRHNDVLVVFVYDPLEMELPDAGRLVVSDGDRQMEVDSGRRALRESFRNGFDRRLAAARQFLLTREVPVLPVDTQGDVAGQLVRLLGGPTARGSR